MKPLNLVRLTSLALILAACGGKEKTGEENTEKSAVTPKEEKVTFTLWNDSTKTMEDFGWTANYQYAEIRNKSIYVVMSDVDLGEDYLTNQPKGSNILFVSTLGLSAEGKQTGTYPTDESGKGNLGPYINGKLKIICCGKYFDKTTSGAVKITKVTNDVIEGEAEQFGFDSSYVKVKFSAPLMAVEGEKTR